MKILVLGATGGTGRQIVEQGIARGHKITALIRDAARQDAFPDHVHTIAGDALDRDAVDRAVAGQDDVIYALGTKQTGQTTFFSESTQLVLQSMEKHGVRRLVCITGIGAGETRGHGGLVYDRLIFPFFTRKIYEDKDRQEALVRRSSVDWVLVRPAVFREGAAKGELQVVTDVNGVTLTRIARHEVARFVLDQLESNQYLRKAPFIGHA
jgi:putative NADH-flavin reductase